jgi:tungstate transport system substrate-binding protein
MKSRSTLLFSLLAICALAFNACAPVTPAPTEPAKPANPLLILATTTSTQDSGLLDVLIPLFEEQSGYKVQTVAVGSGQAMEMGQQGNADVLLVHSPSAEKTFMDDGWGKDRALVMHNDFIIVGPMDDPVGIKGLSAVDAFKAIATAEAHSKLSPRPKRRSLRAPINLERARKNLASGKKQSSIPRRPSQTGTSKPARAWVLL